MYAAHVPEIGIIRIGNGITYIGNYIFTSDGTNYYFSALVHSYSKNRCWRLLYNNADNQIKVYNVEGDNNAKYYGLTPSDGPSGCNYLLYNTITGEAGDLHFIFSLSGWMYSGGDTNYLYVVDSGSSSSQSDFTVTKLSGADNNDLLIEKIYVQNASGNYVSRIHIKYTGAYPGALYSYILPLAGDSFRLNLAHEVVNL